MPTLTEMRQQQEALKQKYGDLPIVDVLTPPQHEQRAVVVRERPKPPKPPTSRNHVPLTDVQIAALTAAGLRYGTPWRRQLDQAIALYLDVREDMPEEDWEDKDLPKEMRSELLPLK